MDIPKVSLIVTVYDAKNYLHICVDSLVRQTLKEIEILLIDDGSRDGSGKICDEYASRDPRIRMIHRENGGIASARQLGIDSVKGEYVTFIDADDWIEADSCEQMYNRAKSSDADMLICDYYKNWPDRQELFRQEPSSLDSRQVIKDLAHYLEGFVCSRLYRREVYQAHNIKFDEKLIAAEDTSWNISSLKQGVKVDYLPKAFYHYCQYTNLSSISKKIYPYEALLYLLESITDISQRAGAQEDIRAKYEWTLVSQEFFAHRLSSKEFKKRCYSYRKSALKYDPKTFIGKLYNIFLYASCKGLYGVCYKIHHFCLTAKRAITR